MSIIVKKVIFVTLIVLLILAGVSLSGLFSEKGLFKRAEDTSNKYNEAKAREVLETVLLTDGQYEKNTNKEYNQDDFLDELIKSEIPGSDIKGDVAIIGEYAYELDRSVPKIGRYLGKASDLVWPKVDATVKLSDDKKDATITITTSEEKQGINKIEIWLLGEIIKEYKYDPAKPEATENYITTQNGTYTIKAYGELWSSITVKVTGIVPTVEFLPNGNTEWKKEHRTKITVKETGGRVTSLKYKWTNSANPPLENEFTEVCNNGDTITSGNNTMTGTYFLWILLTTEEGKTSISGSEGFNFDNQGPTVTLTSIPVSETSFTLTATASDKHSRIAQYEFYVNKVKVDTQITTLENATYTWNGIAMVKDLECYVIVSDELGNLTKGTIKANTKLCVWERWTVKTSKQYYIEKTNTVNGPFEGTAGGNVNNYRWFYYQTFDPINGLGNSISMGDGGRILTYAQSAKYICYYCGQTSIYYICERGSDGKYYEYRATYGQRNIYIKGDSMIDIVKDVTNKYPNKAKYGDYWYIYKGIE